MERIFTMIEDNSKIKIALCQFKVVDNKKHNLEKAHLFIEKAKEANSQIIVLPEMFNCPFDTKLFPEYAEKDNSDTYNFLKESSKNLVLIGGSIPEIDNDDKIYNTSYIFENGDLIGKYRKMNIFDVSYKNKSYKESDTITSGNTPVTVKTSLGNIGIAICFDLRFPLLFQKLEENNPFLYVIPAAFNNTSGPDHFKLLGRSRALDTQSYLALCSPAGNLETKYDPYGHSMIIDPWGKVLNELDDEEGIAIQIIDKEYVNEIRKKLPIKKKLIN